MRVLTDLSEINLCLLGAIFLKLKSSGQRLLLPTLKWFYLLLLQLITTPGVTENLCSFTKRAALVFEHLCILKYCQYTKQLEKGNILKVFKNIHWHPMVSAHQWYGLLCVHQSFPFFRTEEQKYTLMWNQIKIMPCSEAGNQSFRVL